MIKRLFSGLALGSLLLFWGNANALFIQSTPVYSIIDSSSSGSSNVSWTHGYDGSEDPISWATLTITAEDVDVGESIQVSFDGHLLGLLDDQGFYSSGPSSDILAGPGVTGGDVTGLSTTVFNLDPSWITLGLHTTYSIELLGNWWAEIETSTLTVAKAGVPEPMSIVLMGFGLLGLSFARRSK